MTRRLLSTINFQLSTIIALLIGCNPQPTNPPEQKQNDSTQVFAANDYVVYQANEKLFARSGAFKAIDNHLDSLQQMGVNVLWLMPIFPIGELNAVNSPYCIRDFKAVNPAFGTLDDLKNLVNHAHQKGMVVILDWIANHASWDNNWVIEHPDWFTPAQTADERAWNDVTFFDFSKHEVKQAMIEAMTYWVKTADVDGFRCDYAHGCPDEFWVEAIKAIRALKPNAILLAETSHDNLYNAGFDWLYSWNYLSAIQDLYTKGSLANLYAVSDREKFATPKGKERLRYVTNHDACAEKANTQLYKSQEGMLAAACLTYFLGGVPLIYSSQEVGYMRQIPFCCRPEDSPLMNWSDNSATYEAYKEMMAVYHQTKEVRAGSFTHVDSNPDMAILYYKSNNPQSTFLLVAINLSGKEQTANLPIDLQGVGDLQRSITLPAYSYRFYQN